MLTISGRPTFLFEGKQPSYRDLGPGMFGRDVAQLEKALKRAGFDPGTVDSSYDDETARAVTALYRKHGFQPMMATEAELSAVLPAEARLIDGALARAGTQLPADEVMFVPATPLRATKLGVGLGASPEGALLTVSDSVVVVDGALPVD